ncbi:serine/threonine-protein kinase [Planotetraspora mira]|uniref:Protein kinase domain-containing protein n=1 Tax=Planotetraspora mira TaxID=58121 RepID=A0A8J3TUS7_9ACTN|nr:serine/threonine-protein kinase [Planotetraspora mira]GII32582.1 hypothetical protein Pmi06nite_60240 [Planotetraspora mira]
MAPPAPLRADDPRRLGVYRLAGRVGQGGQGVVFLGTAPGGAQVAVKRMHLELDGEKARKRFIAEVEAVRRVAPFCTAQVLDADLDEERPYIVSEYIDGPSLREDIATSGPRSGGSLDRVAVATATALAAIHEAGVVHRDFKPGNVLLGPDGPRVIDFGISRLLDKTETVTLTPVGTPAYISPEQLRGERASPAADMFGWALTVAYTASGRHAYSGESFEAILGRILFGTADLGPLAGRLREVVVACLAADPSDRPTADEVLRHLIGRGELALPDKTPGGVLEAGGVLAAGAILAAGTRPSGDEPSAAAAVSPDAVTDPLNAEDGEEAAAPDPERAELTRPAVVPPWFLRRSAVAAGGVVLMAGVIGATLWWADHGRTSPAPSTPVSASVSASVSVSPSITPSSPGAFSYAGRWTGSAEYPSSDLVFSVELLLAENMAKAGSMRWGANLQCSGRLSRVRETATTTTMRLSRVGGPTGCYPGTVELSPQGLDKMTFQVTRTGETKPRYFGIVVLTP